MRRVAPRHHTTKAIPLAAGAMAWANVVLSPAAGAVLTSLSTVNARLLGPDEATI